MLLIAITRYDQHSTFFSLVLGLLFLRMGKGLNGVNVWMNHHHMMYVSPYPPQLFVNTAFLTCIVVRCT